MAASEGRSPLDGWVAAFLCAACAVFMIFAARVENYGSDTTTYLLLARSILEDGSYTFNFAPHTVYPPGYPLVLAGMMALGIDSWPGLVRATVPIYFLGVWATYHLVRILSGRRMAGLVVLLTVTSHAAFFWSTVGLVSEGIYFTVSVGALLCIEASVRSRRRSARALAIGMAALLVALLPLIRTIGVTVIAGLILWALIPLVAGGGLPEDRFGGRLRRSAPVIVLGLVATLGWIGWADRSAPDYAGDAYMGSYVGQLLKSDPHLIDSPRTSLLELPARSVRMLALRAQRTTQTLLNQPWWDLSSRSPLVLLTLGLVLAGLGGSFLRGATVLDGYILAYLGMLVLWPFDEGNRFLFPVLPFLYLYAMRGLRMAGAIPGAERLRRRAGGAAVAGAVVGLLPVVGAGVYQSVNTARDHLDVDPTTFRVYPTVLAADWIRENTAPDAVIMDEQAAVLHRLSGRKTYRFPLLTDPAEIRELILDTGTDFVVVLDERPFEYFLPSAAQRLATTRDAFPGLFSVVHQFEFGCICSVQGD